MTDPKDLAAEASTRALLDKLPPLPPELVVVLHELDESELLAFVLDRTIGQCKTLMRLCERLRQRCKLCTSETECAACQADMNVIIDVLYETAKIAKVSDEAVGPGTRIAAQREREVERRAAEVKAKAKESQS